MMWCGVDLIMCVLCAHSGQVHHRLGNVPEALRHLNIAMDLDPKEAANLKVRYY